MMQTTVKKITAVFIAVLLCLSCLPAAALAAFTYPAGVTREDALAAIPKTEKLLSVVLKQNEATADLSKGIYTVLFSDETVNAMFKGIYSALGQNADTLKMLGIDISVESVADSLKAYPQISKDIASCATLDDALGKSVNFKWGITDKNGFSSAIATMLSPFNEILYTLLCGTDYNVGSLIKIKGANGYENAVVPIFTALCCKGIMSQSYFSSAAAADRSSMVKNIMSMLYSIIDTVTSTPVASMCKILPAAAYFMQNDGLTNSIKTLVSPLQIKIAGIFSISSISDILDNAGLLQSSDSLTSMLENLDLSAITGSDIDINLADIDLAGLAQCGSIKNGVFVADEAAAYVTILRWVINTAKQNSKLLPSLLGDSISLDGTDELFGNLMKKNTDDIVLMLIKLLNIKSTDNVLEYSWKYAAFTPTTITYTPNLTAENYTKVLDEIDATLNEFLLEFGESGSLTSILSTNIYSNKLISTLVTGLYGALYTDQTSGLLSSLGLDVSPAGIGAAIQNTCPSAAKTLKAAKTWDSLKSANINWGFYNGSRQGFKTALTAVLTPFAPFLRLLLCEGSYNIMDIITVYGSNGYNTAVIPLLEAIGCPSDSIKTYAQYKAGSNTNSVITDIIEPILSLADKIIEKPVYTLCNILPNIMYFLNGNGIKTCVDNILYPVKKILDTVGMTDMLPDEITNISELDISSLVKSVISSDTLSITLPEPNLNAVATLGTAETLASKRTYNGSPAQMTYIKADAPAVLITVLRYVFGALGSEENSGALSSVMGGGAMAGDDMMSMYAGNIVNQLKDMNTDEMIEWFYNLLFAETPKKELPNTEDETIPTVIYEEQNKDNTMTTLIVGIILLVIALTLTIVYIAKHDHNAAAERREQKKRLKLKKKLSKQEQNGDSDTKKAAKHKKEKKKKSIISVTELASDDEPYDEDAEINTENDANTTYEDAVNENINTSDSIISEEKTTVSKQSRKTKQHRTTLKEIRKNQRQVKKALKKSK